MRERICHRHVAPEQLVMGACPADAFSWLRNHVHDVLLRAVAAALFATIYACVLFPIASFYWLVPHWAASRRARAAHMALLAVDTRR